MKSTLRYAGLVTTVLVAFAAGLGVLLFMRQPSIPSEAEGRVWLADFVDRVISPPAWSARGPAALALFPGLGTWSDNGCVLAWTRREPYAPVVTYQRLELGRLGDEPCDQAQFGMLSTTLRQSEGVTPGALAERFTAQFGPPEIHRDTGLSGTITYAWQAQDGIFVHLEEKVQPGGADEFSLLFVRSYASPTHVAGRAEAEQWMDRNVELVTGPALPDARGTAAVRMLDADMRPSRMDTARCATEFDANLLTKGPIGTGQSLMLEQPNGLPCEEARFSWLSMRIWQREPVTGAALVKRIGDRLGAPAVSRDFDRNAVSYVWRTGHGTVVELTEDLSAAGHYWLGLRVWRP